MDTLTRLLAALAACTSVIAVLMFVFTDMLVASMVALVGLALSGLVLYREYGRTAVV